MQAGAGWDGGLVAVGLGKDLLGSGARGVAGEGRRKGDGLKLGRGRPTAPPPGCCGRARGAWHLAAPSTPQGFASRARHALAVT